MILYTSDIDANRRSAMKTSFVYLAVSLFCILFGAVYELYSHGVYSFYMIYAFVFPLAGGTLPYFIFAMTNAKLPGKYARNLYHPGIATLTVGSIIKGVLEIYGTTNSLSCYYLYVGALLIAAGIAIYIVDLIKRK